MVEVYCYLILDGKFLFKNVPMQVKPQVEQRLKDLGYDTDGKPLPTEN